MASREDINHARKWFELGGHGFSTVYGRMLAAALTAAEEERDRLRETLKYRVTSDQHQPDNVQLHGVDVFYNPSNRMITVLYDPIDEEHNCDEMGCRASHVAIRALAAMVSGDIVADASAALHTTETEGSDD